MTKLPTIIVLPGSGGGIDEQSSALLAAHGYTVLALGYFGVAGLPDFLENIPMEYFKKAIHWLKQQSSVNTNKIALVGESRGGELALQLASTFPDEVQAVVAYVPSSVRYGAIPYSNKPAWDYKNVPILPFVHGLTSEQESLTVNEDLIIATKEGKIPFHKNTHDDPYDLSALFKAIAKKDPQALESAAIPVENIHSPLLILTSEDDRLWPSSLYGKLILDRLNKRGSPIKRVYVNFPNTGHEFLFPYLPSANLPYFHPVAKLWLSYGGTMENNAHAAEKSWKMTLDFLKQSLKS